MIVLQQYLPNIVACVLILALGLPISNVLNKTLTKILKKSKLDKAVTGFISSFFKAFTLFIVVILSISRLLGMDLSSIVASLGAIFVAFSIVFKDILFNAISGTTIIGNKLFTIGDIIEVDNITGEVLKVSLFSTKILNLDKKVVTIPNFKLVSESVVSYSKDQEVYFNRSYILKDNTELSRFIEYFGEEFSGSNITSIELCSSGSDGIRLRVCSFCNLERYREEKKKIQSCFEKAIFGGLLNINDE